MPAAPIQMNDPSQFIVQFLQQLNGSRQSSTTSSRVDPAMLQGLQQVLNQQLGQITPEGITQLIGQIFRDGARQVPVLSQQFAQSAGARASNNSPLNLANANLQRQLSDAALARLLEAQSQASKTAGTMAELGKSTTTTQRQKGNPLMMLPFALGQMGNIKKLGQGVAGLFADTGGSDFGTFSVNGSDAMSDAGLAPGFSAGADMGFDIPDYIDGSSVVPDMSFDVGANIGDLISGGNEGLDFFAGELLFADGGKVTKNNENATNRRRAQVDAAEDAAVKGGDVNKATQQARQEEEKKASGNLGAQLIRFLRGYADGGMVKKSSDAPGYANGGEVTTGVQAINNPVGDVVNAGASAAEASDPSVNTGGGYDFSNERLADDVLAYFASLDSEESPSGWSPKSNVYTGKDGNTYRAVQGNGGSGPSGESGYDNPVAPTTGIMQMKPGWEDGKNFYKDNPFNKVFNTDGSFQDVMYNLPPESDLSTLLSFATTAAALATGNPAAIARSFGGKLLGNAAGTFMGGDQKPHQFGGSYVAPNNVRNGTRRAFASGGEVEGPGTGTSDSIPIRVSDGEFIIPADVVEILGEDFFNNILKTYHTPVAQQGAK